MNTISHHAHKSNNLYTVYVLIDPRTDAVRYVGMTQNVYVRFSNHLLCESNNHEKNAWITELKSLQLMVIMRSIEQVKTIQEARIREDYWIRYYRSINAPLLNSTSTCVLVASRAEAYGAGRKRSDQEVNEILDYILVYGSCPEGVAKARQQLNYRTHTRLKERALYLTGMGVELHHSYRSLTK